MIAIDTMSDTLATTAARLTLSWPGAPRSCASASRGAGARGSGRIERATTASRGSSISVPMSRSAMAAYPASGSPSTGGSVVAAAPMAIAASPGQGDFRRTNACSSSPALSACAGAARDASIAGTRLPRTAAATPSAKNTASVSHSACSLGTTSRKYPEPRSPPNERSASSASAKPSARPSALPQAPTIAPSAMISVDESSSREPEHA